MTCFRVVLLLLIQHILSFKSIYILQTHVHTSTALLFIHRVSAWLFVLGSRKKLADTTLLQQTESNMGSHVKSCPWSYISIHSLFSSVFGLPTNSWGRYLCGSSMLYFLTSWSLTSQLCESSDTNLCLAVLIQSDCVPVSQSLHTINEKIQYTQTWV